MSKPSPFLVDASSVFDEYRGVGHLYRMKSVNGEADGSLFLDSILSKKPDINRTRMSARALVSNTAVDKDGDVLMPRGFDIEARYRNNPVWLWDHGLNKNIAFPIGTSRGPDGELDLQITDTEMYATCYFAQSYPDAVQVFQLVDEDVIRAVSVREMPKGQPRQLMKDGQWINVIDRCVLEEISWCLMGVNPETVKKCLDRNRLDGRPIAESIYKSLSAFASPTGRTGRGLPELKSMKMPNDPDDDGEEKDVSKMKSDDAGKDSKEKKKPEETPVDEAGESAGDEVQPETMPEDPSQQPLGSQIIKNLHGRLKDDCKSAESLCGPMLEHQGVKEDVKSMCGNLREHLKSLEGAHDKHYPGTKSGLKSDDMDDDSGGGGDDEGGSDMKSLLAKMPGKQNTIHGIVSSFKSLATMKNITPDQRRLINSNLGVLSGLVSQAKSLQAEQAAVEKSQLKSLTEEMTDEEKRELEAITSKLAKPLTAA